MFNKFIQFWNIVWNSIKDAYNQIYKPQTTESNVQKYNEIKIFNFLWAVVLKLINLTCIEATIDIESDSVLVEALKPYAENIQKKLKSIGRIALSTGSYFIFPTTNSNGNLIHTPIEKERVFILDDDGTRITNAMVILDVFVDDKNNTFYKIGNYRLDANGDLFISYSSLSFAFLVVVFGFSTTGCASSSYFAVKSSNFAFKSFICSLVANLSPQVHSCVLGAFFGVSSSTSINLYFLNVGIPAPSALFIYIAEELLSNIGITLFGATK